MLSRRLRKSLVTPLRPWSQSAIKQVVTSCLRPARCFSTSFHCQDDGRRFKTTSALSPTSGYTAAFAMFEAMWEAGISTCFVNVGSDHPPVLEAFIKGRRERPSTWPRFITCPSEITAISMADGHARITNKPQAVLVHVDVGTQALAHGLHNASAGRAPVLIVAGMAPFTESGELFGSKTEYMHWLQDPPDQKAIVRQYCRYTGEARTGVNMKQMIGRALQFASSAPRGPAYVAAAREVLAQEIEPYALNQSQWDPVEPAALPDKGVEVIAEALVSAERPLIVTGFSGRDHRTPDVLVELADLIPGIRVLDTGGSDVCFPASHVASEGFRLGTHESTSDADAILLLDCDVPWIPAKNAPREDAKIYHVDGDPLNEQITVSFFPANGRWKADSFTSLTQLVKHIKNSPSLRETLQDPSRSGRLQTRVQAHGERLREIASRLRLNDDDTLDGDNIARLLKTCLPETTTFVHETVTAGHSFTDQLQADEPGRYVGCFGTGIGWSNGASLGVKMALQEQEDDSLVCQVVGDGSFNCAAPTSGIWVASKYKIPTLTVVMNNGGWKAPRNSAQIMYNNGGLVPSSSVEETNTSFRPSPNYAALAEAAAGANETEGFMKGIRAANVKEFKEALRHASVRVCKDQKAMLIDAVM